MLIVLKSEMIYSHQKEEKEKEIGFKKEKNNNFILLQHQVWFSSVYRNISYLNAFYLYRSLILALNKVIIILLCNVLFIIY